jgi:hypothetical protein
VGVTGLTENSTDAGNPLGDAVGDLFGAIDRWGDIG